MLIEPELYRPVGKPARVDVEAMNALASNLHKVKVSLNSEEVLERTLQPHVFTYIVRIDRLIRGMTCLIIGTGWPKRKGFVEDVSVLPDFAGLGIATALTKRVIAKGEEAGCNRLQLTSSPDNPDREPARHIYRKLGFVERRPKSGSFVLELS